ncbi:HEAT repeat domain-containing protein [Aurantimicrobium minutum]|uniref:HEAT repeat domain-containing protein n=1 Tax=Aurantimicrobium minutum TaxID=708131 RepID=UPI002475ABAF|nr:HEAT repeat domain-containing protein [Aurantimicrobium minutum]
MIDQIKSLRIFARQQALDISFRMLAEVSGESQRNLALLMTELGAVQKAFTRARSKDSVRRARAAELLGLVNPVGAVDALITLSSDSNREVRMVATRALGRTDTQLAIRQLERLFQQPRSVPSWISGSALLDTASPVDFELSKYLGHPSPVVRQNAVTIASLMPRSDTGLLLGRCLLDDPDRLVRVMAARALGRVQMRVGVEPLTTAALSDPHKSVRIAATQALAQLPSPWTSDALVYLKSPKMDPAVQRAALPAPHGV